MASRNYCSFIKVGESEFMQKLFSEGEIFCKPFKYFKSSELNSLRHDKNEGAAFINQIHDIKLFDPKTQKPFANAKSGQLYFHHPDDKGNIYCLYGIETETLDLSSSDVRRFNLDMTGLNFGDTAILIFDPGEFIKRVKNAVEKSGYVFQWSSVIYYDHTKYVGELSPFYKSTVFSPQKEVRFWIPNKLDKDLTFTIGNISDIAYLLPKEDISKLSYSPL